MSEHEQLPDPMPDDPRKRAEMEGLLNTLDIREARARAKAETDRIHQELTAGRSPQEILDELGGPDEARRIIGNEPTEDLLEEVQGGDSGSLDTIAHDLEREAWLQIMELKSSGASDEDILTHFGGVDELERRIGTKAARSFSQTLENKENQ